ncbi:hypothetical protein SteCoe_22942 [Stentor coeruleus]|uniref:Uncharacterized protein n=1 Tax=Stentor coeruleus TaxID=5963 RepID=A0A1R2BLP3_9CILI|nr:hypothetical protein SteCoe_22942 [Stentor coeruleus]
MEEEKELPVKNEVSEQKSKVKKKSKSTKCFLLLTNIPEDYLFYICSYKEVFAPLIKEKPVGIAFLTFSKIKRRSKCIEMIKSSSPQISMFSFKQKVILKEDQLALNLANEINSIYAMTQNFVQFIKQKSIYKLKSHKTQLGDLEKNTKIACRMYLSKIMLYLNKYFFTKNTSDMCDNEWTDNIFLTHTIFGVCCFFLFKYNKKNLRLFVEYAEYFQVFLRHILSKSINGNMRVLTIDFIYQIVFLKDQFNHEINIISGILQNSIQEQSLSTIFPDLNLKFYDLMRAGHSKIAPEMKKKEYAKFIRVFLNKVCFIPLPKSLSGFTCMNSIVFIRHPKKDLNLNYLPSQAFAFLTILHELGHFYLRKQFKLKSEWFNFETPKNSGTWGNKKPEGGSEFIIKIFGEEPLFATYYGAEYLLNETNWRDKSIIDFRNEFFEESQKNPPSKKNKHRSVRLKKVETDDNIIQLNYCGRKR